MRETSHKLIVGFLSPFSDKAQAVFRFKDIPFDRRAIDAVLRWPG